MKLFLLSFLLIYCTCSVLFAADISTYESVSPDTIKIMEETRLKLIDWLNGINRDAFSPGKFIAKDEITLKDGSTLTGKILDYGPYIGFVDGGKRWIMPRSEITKMTASWGAEKPVKSNIPDIDVTYIERLPRYRSNHLNVGYDPKEKGVYLPKPNNDPVYPAKGTKTTFKAHVVNKGTVESKPFAFEWLIDGKKKGKGNSAALKPGEEVIFDFTWEWQDGSHTVTFKAIPDGNDFSAWNNSHSDATDSLGFSIVVSKSTKDGFDNVLNMVESFSYEDWLQYHIQVMNFLFVASIYPGSPLGCFERVRVDQMYTLNDEEYTKNFEKTGTSEEGYVYHEGKWGFSPWDQYDWRAANIDWGLIHELGHQLGIIDYYTLDFWRYAVFAQDKNGSAIDIGYSYPHSGMMRGHGPHAFEEVTAIAMNWERGKHRGHFGDYLFNLPKECGIRIVDFNGNPIANAELRIFRRGAGVHTEDAGNIKIPEDPVFEGKTDENGVYILPNEEPPLVFTTDNGFTRSASPFGDALVISDTGLMLIEIWKNGRRDAQFTDVTEFVTGRGRGFEDLFVKDIATILPGENDEVKAPKIVSVAGDGWCDRKKVSWANVPENKAVKFRIYSFADGLPFQRTYMKEIATVNADGPYAMSIVHLNGWVSMTGIDESGNESAPSEPVYVPSLYFSKFDVNSKGEIFTADQIVQQMETDGSIRLFPTRSSLGFWQASAVAIGSKDEIIALSRDRNGVCIFGADGRETIHFGEKGSGDGQLSLPADIDIDSSGRFYIADTGNNRIVVFSPDHKFVANAGVGALEKPVAIEADINGNIYVIQEGKPGIVKIAKDGDKYGAPAPFIKTATQPWDLTSDASGRIYVSVNADPGLLIFDGASGNTASLAKWEAESLKGIASLAIDHRGFLVCAARERGMIIRIPLSDIKKNK
jgi:hypothetical protein